MNRSPGPAPEDPLAVPALPRPTTATRRLRGRLERLRSARRRVAIAAGAGLLAAGLTTAWLTAGPRPRSDNDRSVVASGEPSNATEGRGVPPPAAPTDRRPLADDQRILALDRSVIALPVDVDSVVEVIGLRPVATDVRVEVIATRATVVGVTDQAILIAVDADAAHTAAEIAAVGRVTILGRTGPAG